MVLVLIVAVLLFTTGGVVHRRERPVLAGILVLAAGLLVVYAFTHTAPRPVPLSSGFSQPR